MLISQALGLGHNENHKTGYFAESMPSPLSITASTLSSSHQSIANASHSLSVYPPAESYFVPGRRQPEIPAMYSGQPGSSTFASPANYASVAGTVPAGPVFRSNYSTGVEHTSYYPGTLSDGYDMKPGMGDLWPGAYPQPPPSYYPYENTFGSQYHYDRYCGMDMNDGVRRKNATRESTNTLKSWLQEHKKNPYPTKGEKIMLAIITKMTLTQVSTWFANARRRLKKENKMTWVPKNRSNDANNNSNNKKTDDDINDDDDDDDDDDVISQNNNDTKSDVDRSVDSDEVSDRRVTSTNNNDVTGSPLSRDDAYLEECQTTSADISSNSVDKPELPVAPSTLTTESLPPRFNEATCKQAWSPAGQDKDYLSDGNVKPLVLTKAESLSLKPHENNFTLTPFNSRHPSVIMDQSLKSTKGVHNQGECRYADSWPSDYRSPIESGNFTSPVAHPDSMSENAENPNSRDLSYNKTEDFVPNHMYNANPVSRSTSPRSPTAITSSKATPSFVGGLSQEVPHSSIDYYRPAERLPYNIAANSTYYHHQGFNAQLGHYQSDHFPTTYIPNGESLPPKISAAVMNSPSTPSPSGGSTTSPLPDQVYQNHLPRTSYYPTPPSLSKPSEEASTFHNSYYQPDMTFVQPAVDNTASNLDFYPRYSVQERTCFNSQDSTMSRE